jgi:hypothetical protein
VPTLSAQLVADFGNGFSRPNLFRMIRFAEVFSDNKIVSTLSRQLSWSHFVEIIPRTPRLGSKSSPLQRLSSPVSFRHDFSRFFSRILRKLGSQQRTEAG